MKDARYTAAQALTRLCAGQAYSNLVLEPLVARNRLDAREGAFAWALFYTTLERLLTIDHILAHHLSRPPQKLDDAVLQALRLGICQLLYMDGVDDYAAVNESVNLVRTLGKPKAAGLVNGVLRSFLRTGKTVPPAPASDGRAGQLSIDYACPKWLVQVWLDAYGEQAAQRILQASLGKPPLYLRVNTLQTEAESLVALLEQQGVRAVPQQEPSGCLLVEGNAAVERLDAFAQGMFHVQDRASQFCAAALGAQPGERVLDVCAAPGGKSFTIAQHMNDSGELVARDLHEKRVKLIRDGAQRLGISCIRAQAGDAGVYDPALGLFDRVLCDVPCSGFGIIRRKPEIKYKPPASIQTLPDVQYKILETSSKYLKVEGLLVYSTCTLLPQENERVVERFLSGRTDYVLLSQETFLGGQTDTDGFFIAILQKR